MMQVTGNSLKNIKSASIQLSLNGLSFFNTKGINLNQGEISFNDTEQILLFLKELRKLSSRITILVATDNFVMLPSELYSEKDEDVYFIAKSLPYDNNKFQYHKYSYDNFVFITSFDRRVLNSVELFFEDIEITHPLISVIKKSIKTNSLCFSLINNRFAISFAKNNTAYFAEFLPISTKLDIIYYLKKTINDFDIKDNIIYCLNQKSHNISEYLSTQINNSIKYENS